MAQLLKRNNGRSLRSIKDFELIQDIKNEWESSLDSVGKLICVLDAERKIIRVNRTLEKWGLGSVKNSKGTDVHAAIHPDCEDENCYLHKLLNLSDGVNLTEEGLGYRVYDEQLKRHLHLELNPIHEKADLDEHLVLTVSDVSHLALAPEAVVNNPWRWLNSAMQVKADSTLNNFITEVKPYVSKVTPTLSDARTIEKIKREWESTVDSLPQIVCVVGQDGKIIRVNRAIERWSLGNVSNVVGKNIHSVLHRHCHDASCYISNINQLIVASIVESDVAQCQFYDPVMDRNLLVQISPNLKNDSKHLAVVQIIDLSELQYAEKDLQKLIDILELRIRQKNRDLKKANVKLQGEVERRIVTENKLRASRNELSSLLSKMGEGMVVEDQDLKITYANPRLRRMLGFSQNEILGKRFSEFLEHDAVNANKTSFVARIKTAADKKFWVKVSPKSLKKPNTKENKSSFSVITDINDHIEMKMKLEETERQLKLLNKEVSIAQENERKRIAIELHDGVGQTLSAIKFYVENTVHTLLKKNSSQAHDFDIVILKLQHAIEEVRRISMDLRPSMLDDIGLVATINWFSRESARLFKSINFKFTHAGIEEDEIPPELKTVIFRVCQEATNNATKHSNAKVVDISLKNDSNKIVLEVRDDGTGFDTRVLNSSNGYRQSAGLGLASMRERAESFKGGFKIDSTLKKGTSVICTWSLDDL